VFGRAVDEDYGDVIERLVRGGLVVDDGERLGVSETGKLLYDLVALAFYPKHAQRWLDTREARAPSTRSAAR